MLKFHKLILVSSVIVGSLFFASCNKNEKNFSEVPSKKLTDIEIITLTKKAGVTHNKALDNILNRIQKIPTSKSYVGARTAPQQQQFDEIGRAVLQEPVLTVRDDYGGVYYIDSLRGINFIKTAVLEVNDSTMYTITRQIQDQTLVISPTLESLVNQVNSTLQNATNSTDLNLQLDDLLTSQLPNLTEEAERLAFAASISVAKSSFQYWSDPNTVARWSGLSESNPVERVMKAAPIDGRQLAKADFNGAVSGAITGAKYGFAATVAGGGVGGGIAGGVLGGALGAVGMSTVNGLKQVFHVSTPWWLEWTGL